MADVFDIEMIRAQHRRTMKAKGVTARRWAIRAGLEETAVRDILKSHSADPKASTLFKLADAVDLPIESLIGDHRVPLTGRIGAGGQVVWLPEDDEPSFVPRPPLEPGPLMALEVSGDSMLPKYEPGDVIYIRRIMKASFPNIWGNIAPCIASMAELI